MRLDYQRFGLNLRHEWTIASKLGDRGLRVAPAILVELTHGELSGRGEANPPQRYGESEASVIAFLQRVEERGLSFDHIPGSMKYLESVAPGNRSAKSAINLALLDGAARQANQPVHDWLGLKFIEGQHLTSFSIGLDAAETTRRKVLEAAEFPVLKIKVGSPDDRANWAVLRQAAPGKRVRADANEGWSTKEEALRNLEWLAADGKVEFVEQPMPAETPLADLVWLKARSPLPLFADEVYHHAADAARCAEGFHGVNVKLAKTGGLTGALAALKAARQAGLKTMIGCMIESSLAITAAAHLAELADYLDLDGNLLISNDPFVGCTAKQGVLSLAEAPARTGLQVLAVNPGAAGMAVQSKGL